MGTSSSNPGPGNNSPLVPPWAADGEVQIAPIGTLNLKTSRQLMGKFVADGSQRTLRSALSSYAKKGTGGGGNAAKRMSRATSVGSNLYFVLSGSPQNTSLPEDKVVDLQSLNGKPVDVAIQTITEALVPVGGDADKIRVSLNRALAQGLDGVEVFDPNAIGVDIITKTMIAYLTDNIFVQVVTDMATAWEKAKTPKQAVEREQDLREFVRVLVDKRMATLLKSSKKKSFSWKEMKSLQDKVIEEVWDEWENIDD